MRLHALAKQLDQAVVEETWSPATQTSTSARAFTSAMISMKVDAMASAAASVRVPASTHIVWQTESRTSAGNHRNIHKPYGAKHAYTGLNRHPAYQGAASIQSTTHSSLHYTHNRGGTNRQEWYRLHRGQSRNPHECTLNESSPGGPPGHPAAVYSITSQTSSFGPVLCRLLRNTHAS